MNVYLQTVLPIFKYYQNIENGVYQYNYIKFKANISHKG